MQKLILHFGEDRIKEFTLDNSFNYRQNQKSGGVSMKSLSASIWLRPFIILLVFAHFFSCYSWKRLNQPIEEYLETNPEKVLVEKIDKSEIELYYAYIQSDSIKGDVHRLGGWYQPDKKIFISIPLNEIQSIYI
jgi:hypothetical protein